MDMLRLFRDNAIIPNNFEEIIDLLNSNEIKTRFIYRNGYCT